MHPLMSSSMVPTLTARHIIILQGNSINSPFSLGIVHLLFTLIPKVKESHPCLARMHIQEAKKNPTVDLYIYICTRFIF